MGKFFEVSPKERALYTFKVPEGYLRAGAGDYVSYHAVGTDEESKSAIRYCSRKDESGKVLFPSHVNRPCYSDIRQYYQKYDITCVPNIRAKDSAIDLAQAVDFFQIMSRNGIIPEKGITLREETHESWGKGVVCHIEPEGPSAQKIYAALTCYRWIDAHPSMVWEFLKTYRCGLNLSPFQILPYLIAKYVSNTNHSFISSSKRDCLYDGGIAANHLNPVLGVAAKAFFDEADKRGISSQKPDDHINTAISSICSSLTESQQVEAPRAGKITQLVYAVSLPEDTLHPKFKPLYEIPNITKQQVSEILSKLFTEGK